MKTFRHLRFVGCAPELAQISNFQIKLESTTAIIDRLLLVPRQQPWKSTGPSGDVDDTTGTDTTGTGTGTGTGLEL